MTISKADAKERVSKLVEHFKKDLESGKANKYSEEETKTRYIQPLFEALGWDFSAVSDEVSMEENISKKRVDYGFRINGIPKFFVEAKRVKADLNDPIFSKQAIDYSWHKDCAWAILTDFEGLKVFNAEWKYTGDPSINKFKEFAHYEYVPRFEELWLLSRESMEEGKLSAEALKVGKKRMKTPVGKQIFEDMMRWRGALSKDIVKHNSKYDISSDELDEAVQRILDRLVFVRTAEDRRISVGPKLIELVRDFESRKRGKVIDALNELFREYDKAFNSKLFASGHFSEDLKIDNDVLMDVIRGTYRTSDGSIHYDFSAINADVLGNMYEQYLGHLLKKTAKRAKVEKSHKKRKEQGIYYTPTYVVDYIVKNTVGEHIKGKRAETVANIKVLDPACGSGSFLLRVFDELDSYWARKLKGKYGQSKLGGDGVPITKKIEILRDNVYGVDLDEKAVEISRLNLLLKAAEKRHLLPALDKNVKVGNSLIDDAEVAGDKAFNWDSEFEGIMAEGGFDIIVGNPPYVDIKTLPPDQVAALFSGYKTAENRINLYSLFVERCVKLLKKGGYFGFIIPNSILFNSSYEKIRRFLMETTNLVKIVRMPDNVFEGAKVETIILIFKKKDSMKINKTQILLYDSDGKIDLISKETANQTLTVNQRGWDKNEKKVFNIFADEKVSSVLRKIVQDTVPLIKVADFSLGLTPYDKYKGHTQEQIKTRVFHANHQKDSTFKRLLSGGDILRYGVFWNGENWIKYGNKLGAPREERFFTRPRILIRQIVSGKPPRIYAGYSELELYNSQVAFNILIRDENQVRIKYVLALLNSKLINFYHREKFLDKSKRLFQKILIQNAKLFPIKISNMVKQEEIVVLVDKLRHLVERNNVLKDKQTDEKFRIEQEILKIDTEIDDKIYRIYGITEKEKKMIEERLK